MENTALLNQWTEYCSNLCNYKLHPDTSPLQRNQTPTQEAESLPVLIMLWVVLNRLKAKSEELLAEDQAGVRPGWSTVEQIFHSQVITEKHLQL